MGTEKLERKVKKLKRVRNGAYILGFLTLPFVIGVFFLVYAAFKGREARQLEYTILEIEAKQT